jgi:hypothetical protein
LDQAEVVLLQRRAGEQRARPRVAFGLALRHCGRRITFLGPDTPLDSLAEAAARSRPAAVVLAATAGDRFEDGRGALAGLSPLWIAGSARRPGSRRTWAPGCSTPTRWPRRCAWRRRDRSRLDGAWLRSDTSTSAASRSAVARRSSSRR